MVYAGCKEARVQASEILNIVGNHDPVDFRRALEQIRIILAFELSVSLDSRDIMSTLAKFMGDAGIEHLVQQELHLCRAACSRSH